MEPSLTPYLNFNGNTSEAMKSYQSILGGELTMQTFGEASMAETPEEKNLIVHAALKSDGLSLMASDTHPNEPAKFGDNVHLSISGQDGARITEIFNRLGQGGKIDMALAKQFWGDTFGMLTDKFGVHWMVNITSQAQS
ncbi:MAG: VOC family protein [Thaumarchaeota archaeon]|nr:VOC family protein [Nitrososphaerota archaeon]